MPERQRMCMCTGSIMLLLTTLLQACLTITILFCTHSMTVSAFKIWCLWCTQPRHANMSLLSQHLNLEAQLLLLQAEVPAPESNA